MRRGTWWLVVVFVAVASGLTSPAHARPASNQAASKSRQAVSPRSSASKDSAQKATPSKPAPASSRDKATASTSKAAAPPRSSVASRASARQKRLAMLARQKAERQAREYREVATPQFRVDESGNLVPDVRAAAAVIYNPVTGEVLFEENGDVARSIASITKVMTAVVLLEHEFDLSREVEVSASDVRGARHTYLRAGDRARIDDLLHLMLIASDNAAARTLARTSPFGYDGFVQQMTAKAQELGLDATRYADPSGLDPENVSSALDMARLIAFASNDPRISAIMRKSEHRVVTGRRVITAHSTNRLLKSDVDVQGGKTGFIRSAGYCLATLLRLPQGDPIAVVVLGARSNAARFMETRHLLNWVSSRTQSMLGLAVERPGSSDPDDQDRDQP